MFTDGKVPSSTTMNCAIDKVSSNANPARSNANPHGCARRRFAQLITWPASAVADRFGIPVTG